jgi:predicted  nucleic acid-binding Zn-ribbon protein
MVIVGDQAKQAETGQGAALIRAEHYKRQNLARAQKAEKWQVHWYTKATDRKATITKLRAEAQRLQSERAQLLAQVADLHDQIEGSGLAKELRLCQRELDSMRDQYLKAQAAHSQAVNDLQQISQHYSSQTDAQAQAAKSHQTYAMLKARIRKLEDDRAKLYGMVEQMDQAEAGLSDKISELDQALADERDHSDGQIEALAECLDSLEMIATLMPDRLGAGGHKAIAKARAALGLDTEPEGKRHSGALGSQGPQNERGIQ